MKISYLLVAALLFVNFNVLGQAKVMCNELSLRQLLTLTSKNLNEFDSYVRSKCYYQKGASDIYGRGEEHDYQFKKDETTNGDVVRFGIFKSDDSKFIAYLTISETKYNSLKKELNLLGFNYVNSEYKGNRTTMSYSSEKYEVHINYINETNKYKYNFSIFKK